MALISGKTGTGEDDIIDGGSLFGGFLNGEIIIDGGLGNDTMVIFAERSNFSITDLSGIVRIVGLDNTLFPYRNGTISLLNIEKIQFTDSVITLIQPSNNIIIKSNFASSVKGTSSNDSIDNRGRPADEVDGAAGIDTVVYFADSSDFTITNLSGFVHVRGHDSAPSPYTNDTVRLINVEKVQFLDKTVTLTNSVVTDSTDYSISPATISINENMDSQSFIITRSGGLSAETVYVSTTTTEGFSNNGDYNGILNLPTSFNEDETTASISVNIINDVVPEQYETFGLIIQKNASDPATTFLAKSTFTITDDDSSINPAPEFQETTDNIFVAALNLSARAYSDTHHGDQSVINTINARTQGWVALNSENLNFSKEGGNFIPIGDDLLRYEYKNASATVGLTMLDGKRTLGIAFEGTNDEQDWLQNTKNINEYYDLLSDFSQAVHDYIKDSDNNIKQILVTGHSLGGAAAQNFMLAYGHNDAKFIGITFGSPGSLSPPEQLPNDRFVNIRHNNDGAFIAGGARGYKVEGSIINVFIDELSLVQEHSLFDLSDSATSYRKTVEFITSQLDAGLLFRDLSIVPGTHGDDNLNARIGKSGEVILGGRGDDILKAGLAGGLDTQIFKGGFGNDAIDGSGGVDYALYDGSRANYRVERDGNAPDQWIIIDQRLAPSSEGMDTLKSIERIIFSDTALALDVDGAVGKVTKLLGAIFSPNSISNPEYVAIGLAELDKGTKYEDLAAFAIAAAGASTPEQVTTLLWNNVVGSAPTIDQIQPFVNMLNSGTSTGELGVLAAEHELNQTNINLVGLKESGIIFDPLDLVWG